MTPLPQSLDELTVLEEETEEVSEFLQCTINLPEYRDRYGDRHAAEQELVDTRFGIGELLPGDYRLGRVLRASNISILVEARDAQGESVLVKLLRREQLDSYHSALFKHSIAIGTQLPRDHFARILDAGNLDGIPYYVMEDLYGKSLAEVMFGCGSVVWQFAFFVGEDISDALSILDAQGVVHRDVTPKNIIVVPAEELKVKLIDYDYAWSSKLEDECSYSDAVVGTARFISPEHTLAQPLDIRSDIYSLGCTLYMLIAGQPVFLHDSEVQVLKAHALEQPTPLSEIVPDIPRDVERIVMRCLEKDPADRFQTAEELKDHLTSALS